MSTRPGDGGRKGFDKMDLFVVLIEEKCKRCFVGKGGLALTQKGADSAPTSRTFRISLSSPSSHLPHLPQSSILLCPTTCLPVPGTRLSTLLCSITLIRFTCSGPVRFYDPFREIITSYGDLDWFIAVGHAGIWDFGGSLSSEKAQTCEGFTTGG